MKFIRKIRARLYFEWVKRKVAGKGSVGRFWMSGAFPKIECAGRMTIGKDVIFRGDEGRIHISSRADGEIEIGEGCFVNSSVSIGASHSVTIGQFSKIGNGTIIDDNAFHEVDQGSGVKVAPIKIGKNVWIAKNCTILPGVTIGDHSVIGVGSVVTGDIPSKVLAGGVPARVIREIQCADDYIRS